MPARIVEVRVADELTWYVVSALFATAYMARQAWEEVERKVPQGGLGIYRHGPDSELRGRVVTVVSLDRRQVLRCCRLLRLGADYALDEPTLRGLIGRRARVVLDHAGEPAGRVKWRRPEERGATLNPDGTMREPGGQG